MSETKLMVIPLKDVVPSSTNPRKTFDQAKTEELAESIREKGVLQPILVRAKGSKFEIVCGERRYRASKMVHAAHKERNTIPAVIRELSDQEVREMQLIENFQREDVHPMEEAVAIKYAVESGQYSFEDLAHKVGKSLTYVKLRMKLNDLVPSFQQLFFNGNISLSNAIKLATFSSTVQEQMIEDDIEMDDYLKNPNEKFEPSRWWLEKYEGNLSQATFDLNDATLITKAGACTKCHFNTSVALLFPDDENKARCSNINCFTSKTSLAFERELEKIKEDPTAILISTNYSQFVDKKLVADLVAEGHEVYASSTWGELDKPEPPDWDEFKEMEDYDDQDEAEKTRLLKSFNAEKKEYEKDLKEYEERIASGKYKKGFVVDGNGIGKIKYVTVHKKMPKGGIAADKKVDTKSDEVTAGDIDMEISRLKEKEKRNKEIDQNKIWEALLPQFNPGANSSMLKEEFKAIERKAIAMALHEKLEYKDRRDYEEQFGWKEKKGQYPEVDEVTIRQMIRFYMLSVLPPSVLYRGWAENEKALMSIEIAKLYFSSLLDDAIQTQNEKAAKRSAKVETVIKDLQKKKKELAALPVKKKRSGKSAAANDDTQDDEE